MHQVGFNYFDDNIISKKQKNQYNSDAGQQAKELKPGKKRSLEEEEEKKKAKEEKRGEQGDAKSANFH